MSIGHFYLTAIYHHHHHLHHHHHHYHHHHLLVLEYVCELVANVRVCSSQSLLTSDHLL